MSVLLRDRSIASRLRNDGRIVTETFGPLHGDRRSLLEWGSITKTVTAVLTRRLSARGAVDLSAPASEYLPDSGLPVWVDVRSLITHTSGLPAMPSDVLATWAERKNPFAKYTTARFDEQIVPRLGEEHTGRVGVYAYSNLGYAVLTRILEIVAGQTWWQLARESILNPWGVSDVAVNHVDQLDAVDRERTLELRTWTGAHRGTWIDTGPFVGAGGLLGTFDALERYAIAARANAGPGRPCGWMRSATLWWHNGHNRDQGAFVGISDTGERVVTVHAIGHRVGASDRIATRLVRRHPS